MNKDLFKKVSKQLNLSDEVVEKTYKAYWYFIKDTIESLNLNKELSEEDFNKLKTSFNLPSLGKISCTYNRIIKNKKDVKDN